VDEFIATNCIFHAFDRVLKGPEQFRQYAKELLTVFPDIHFTIEDLIAEGDMVVSHWTLTGTQKGEFLEIPATNKKVEFQGSFIFEQTHQRSLDCFCVFSKIFSTGNAYK
jgi:predicted ester cyclase